MIPTNNSHDEMSVYLDWLIDQERQSESNEYRLDVDKGVVVDSWMYEYRINTVGGGVGGGIGVGVGGVGGGIGGDGVGGGGVGVGGGVGGGSVGGGVGSVGGGIGGLN